MATSGTATGLLTARTNCTDEQKTGISSRPHQKPPDQSSSPAVAALSKYSTSKPDAKDILLGRGKPFQNHPGNVIMRRLLNKYKDRYNESHRDARSDIAMELIDRLLEAGARFLKRRFEGDDGGKSTTGASWIWEEASRSEAYDKVCHALRSGRKAARKASDQKSVMTFAAVLSSEAGKGNDGTLVREASSDERVSADVVRSGVGARHSRIGHVGRFPNEIGVLPPVAATAQTVSGLRESLLLSGTRAPPFLPAVTSVGRHLQLSPFSLASAATRNDSMNILGTPPPLANNNRAGVFPPSIYYASMALPPRGGALDRLSLLSLRRNLFEDRSDFYLPSPVADVDLSVSTAAALNAYIMRRGQQW